MKDKTSVQTDLVLHMCRSSNDTTWRLEIIDGLSNTHVLEVVLDAEQFSNLLCNRQAHGQGVIWQSQHYGKRHEYKTINVVVPANVHHNDNTITTLARKAQLVEDKAGNGWVVEQDKWNRHHFDPDTRTYALRARRWL